VAESTLRCRFQGGKNHHKGHEIQAHLDDEQEEVLIEYCKYQGLLAQPLSSLALRQHVYHLSGKQPSEEWVRHFFARHKEILMKTARGLDPKRAVAFSCKNEVVTRNIPPQNIFNFDEKGIQLGGGRKNIRSKYIFSAVDANRYVKKSDNLVLVTILECVLATGKLCPPGFVLPKGTVREWSHVDDVGGVATSENSWTDDKICVQWFREVFVPWAKRERDPTFPIVFISDGHGSHKTSSMRAVAVENDIMLISLPPHTTHRLQPLDVGVFAPIQHEW
ncbi:hypothetical protein M422DRAFT_141415, partial [Sphaerobolus stellatus SS14]